MDQQCDIQRPKQWVVTAQITCRAGEPLESVCWRPVLGDRTGDSVIRQRGGRAAAVRRLVGVAGVMSRKRRRKP